MSKRVLKEHFVPDDGMTISDYLAEEDVTAVHHLIRYKWAEAVLADSLPASIIDIACGSGFGSYQLAVRFPRASVVGVDTDAQAIAFAGGKYVLPNLRFIESDVRCWDEDLGGALFDCVVSFDTIEHIAHREIMMQSIVEHLRSDGMLLLSTPIKHKTVLTPPWEHHKIEFSSRSLFDFLSRYFYKVLAPDHRNLPHLQVFDEINTERVVYLLKMNPVLCLAPRLIAWPG